MPTSFVPFGCRRRGDELIPHEERDVLECWCGARSVTGAAFVAGRRPWLTQPGWQVAVATRTPWRFRLEQAVARIFRR